MKCQFAAVAVTFLAAISPRVVADGSGRRTGFVRTGSTNIFANDDETNVDRNTEEPTEAAEEVAVAVLNQTTIVSNIFIEEEAVGTVAVAAPRDPSNMLTNEIIGGYQGWFAFPDDGAPVNKWRHWFRDPISNTSAPEAKQLGVDLYATTDEYDAEDLHTSSNILLPDGSPAKFFSSARPRVVLKHFEWMANYGITGIFHIRFMQSIDIPANRQWKDMVLRNVKNAAEATGRIFAVSYNVAGCTNDILDDVKNDWIQLVDNEQITQSPRYIRQRGLPVLRIYGIGFKAVNVTDTVQLANLIQWFQKDAPEKYRVFLIGGVPSRWRDRTVDSRGELVWTTIYNSLDGIHPWHVGRWGSIGDFNSYNANIISKDAAYCKDRGILYMPTMWPGFSWHNLKNSTEPINAIPRQGGNFFWKQAHAFAANSNITSVWLAQIDELDEGTAIIKVTAKTSDLPVHGKWLALDADGQSLPSDWYLRLGGEAQRMFEGTRPVTSVIPIKPTDPPPPDSLVSSLQSTVQACSFEKSLKCMHSYAFSLLCLHFLFWLH